MDLEDILKDVENTLSEKRYYHSKCVMDVCEQLAKKYNVDIDIAKKVGIAHDIAKEMTEEEKLKYVKENNIEVDEIEQIHTGLLHAKIGADIAIKKYGFNKEMAQAIVAHTTGKKNMTMLAKILYIADWIGLDRKYFNTAYIRELANENIDEAIIYTLEEIIKDKFEAKEVVHIDTILARNSLLKSLK